MIGVAGSLIGPAVEVPRRDTSRPKVDPPTVARGFLEGLKGSGLSDAQIAAIIDELPRSRQAVQRAKARLAARPGAADDE